jgi:hypothetical protein
MPATEAIEWMIKIGKPLFPRKHECDKRISNLKELLQEILVKQDLPSDIAIRDPRLQNPASKCKVYVIFVPYHTIASPELLSKFGELGRITGYPVIRLCNTDRARIRANSRDVAKPDFF